MIKKIILFFWFVNLTSTVCGQTTDTLKYYYPYYPDSLNTCGFIGYCLDPGWCEPIAVRFTPDSSKPDTSYHSYSISEVRFGFASKDTAFSIHFGSQFPSNNNRAYRETINITAENINQNFLYDGVLLFTPFDISHIETLQNISLNIPFWVLLEGKVGTVHNTNKPGSPPTTSGHSYQAGLPSGWHNSDCDWIIETVVEYHKDKVNSIKVQGTDILPKRSFLQQNYPNPFNASETQINYTLQSSGFVEINIYSINGKRVATLIGEQQKKGSFSTKLNISKLASGTYFYTLLIDQIFQDSKKMILIK